MCLPSGEVGWGLSYAMNCKSNKKSMNYHFYRRKSFICALRTVYLYMRLFVLLCCSSLIISCLNVLTKCVLSCSEDRMMLVGGKYDAGRSIVISWSEDINRAVFCINIDVSSSFPLKKCILFCDSSNSLYFCLASVSLSGLAGVVLQESRFMRCLPVR